MNSELLSSIVVVAFASAIAGRLVDFSAVWFLFHPYRQLNIPLIRKLGVLPRRQKELALQVARLIEERLITREAISRYLGSDDISDRVRSTVQDALRAIAETEHPSVRDLLTRELGSALDIDREIRVFADWVGERVGDLVQRPVFRSRVANLISDFLEGQRSRPLGELLPPGTLEAIASYLAGRWDAIALDADAAARKLDSWASTLGFITDFVPTEAIDIARKRIRDRLPYWLILLEELLREEKTKTAIKTYLFDVIDRLAASSPNLFSVEGLLGAWRTLFPEDFSRRLDALVDETLPRVRKALEDPQNLEFLRCRVDLWFEELTGSPLGSFYLRLNPGARGELRELVGIALRSPSVRRTVIWAIDQALAKTRQTQLDQVVPSELFEFDPVARRQGEIAQLAPEALCEFILPQIECLLGPSAMQPFVEAATSHDRHRMAQLLEACLPRLKGDSYREVQLYRLRLLDEALQPVNHDRDWVLRAVDNASTMLGEAPAQDLIRSWTTRGIEGLLGIPIGAPASVLRAERIAMVEDIAVRQIVGLLRDHSYRIAQAIDLKDMIRERIEAADPAAIENVVKRQLARDEFNTIFLIGLLFGGVVGLVVTGLFHGVAALWGLPAVLVVGIVLVAVMLWVVRV